MGGMGRGWWDVAEFYHGGETEEMDGTVLVKGMIQLFCELISGNVDIYPETPCRVL